jgi:predicted nucleotidyltransferase
MLKREFTKEEKTQLVDEVAYLLAGKEYILFAYIFGSFVTADSFQDIDVGIYVKEGTEESLILELDIERELEGTVGLPVDVRIINRAPSSFVYNILKDKIMVLERDGLIRSDFESLIFKKYFDQRRFTKEYLREIINAPL